MLAYVRRFTYLSAAKNSNKEYLTYGKGKHKIRENHSFRRNLLRSVGGIVGIVGSHDAVERGVKLRFGYLVGALEGVNGTGDPCGAVLQVGVARLLVVACGYMFQSAVDEGGLWRAAHDGNGHRLAGEGGHRLAHEVEPRVELEHDGLFGHLSQGERNIGV